MADKTVSTEEVKERVDLYYEALNNYEVKKGRLIRLLLDAGYQFYDNIYDYSEGALISPQLLESEDWKTYARFDDEDEVWHIDELTSFLSKGDMDWNAGYHIIDL